ncbi:glycosidase [Spirochaetia bacterium]|nr:glycosidase [Spirochaetia bacterium]
MSATHTSAAHTSAAHTSATHRSLTLTRLDEPNLQPDYSRLVIRSFVPTGERILSIIDRIAALPDEVIHAELEQVISEFSADHGDLVGRIKAHYAEAVTRLGEITAPRPSKGCIADQGPVPNSRALSPEGRLLAGAYFTSEYAFEATALFNPSIVAAPVQDTAAGTLRFIMSVRSVGEGHVSSISFRTGQIDTSGGVTIEPVKRTAVMGTQKSGDGIRRIQFDSHTHISERLLFPAAPEEQNGIEDARFVRFARSDGSVRYYGTYTAYDGKNILPKIIETRDFLKFKMLPLSGGMTRNKGMALFPRKIRGRYAMLSRVDGESIYLMFSENLQIWNEGIKIAAPRFPWEFMQIGNCGSPIETPQGWLVLTHGVGSLRRYSIGALLLDKEDPAKVKGRLALPLISPGVRERTGYVPNVVYTCGAIINEGRLIIPYGSADFSIAFITVDVNELMGRLCATDI